MIHKIVIGVIIGLITIAIPVLAQSDWPPFAGIARVKAIQDQQTEDEIRNIWFQDYCTASKNHNIEAAKSAAESVDLLENRLSSPYSVTVLPCP